MITMSTEMREVMAKVSVALDRELGQEKPDDSRLIRLTAAAVSLLLVRALGGEG